MSAIVDRGPTGSGTTKRLGPWLELGGKLPAASLAGSLVVKTSSENKMRDRFIADNGREENEREQ